MPLGVGIAALQASLYDVPGGYRAVMFDRFSGVNDKVRYFDFWYLTTATLTVGYYLGYRRGYALPCAVASTCHFVRLPY